MGDNTPKDKQQTNAIIALVALAACLVIAAIVLLGIFQPTPASSPPIERPSASEPGPTQEPLASRTAAPDAVSANSFIGAWVGEIEGQPEITVELNLVLPDDLTANDGCNSGTGSWTSEGSVVSFTQFTSTLMACEGFDTWLYEAERGQVDAEGATMELYNDAGESIGTLYRVDEKIIPGSEIGAKKELTEEEMERLHAQPKFLVHKLYQGHLPSNGAGQ